MLQMILVGVFFLAGLFAFLTRELRATKRRVVRGTPVWVLGGVYWLCAALPLVLDVLTGAVAALVLFMTATAVAIWKTPPSKAKRSGKRGKASSKKKRARSALPASA
jgi:hypothetical protein